MTSTSAAPSSRNRSESFSLRVTTASRCRRTARSCILVHAVMAFQRSRAADVEVSSARREKSWLMTSWKVPTTRACGFIRFRIGARRMNSSHSRSMTSACSIRRRPSPSSNQGSQRIGDAAGSRRRIAFSNRPGNSARSRMEPAGCSRRGGTTPRTSSRTLPSESDGATATTWPHRRCTLATSRK